jgi:hypothetical protein
MGTKPLKTCQLCGQVVVLEECKIDDEGRAVHGQCYVAQITSRHQQTAHTPQLHTERVPFEMLIEPRIPRMTIEERERMKTLCIQIQTENDQQRFLELAEELNALLERRPQRIAMN